MLSRSLHGRFLRAVLALSAVLVVVTSIVVYQVARTRYVSAERASIAAMVSAVEKSLGVGAYAGDKILLQELLDGLARHPMVRGVRITDPGGKVLLSAANGAPEGSTAVAGADVEATLTSPFDAKESVGRLHLWLDAERLSERAGQQAAMLAGALAVTLLLVLAVFDALARRLLSRPMHQLAHDLARIAPGTTDRVQVHRQHADDEVGTVARAANQLLELQVGALAREREMREAVAKLEARYRGIFDSSSAGIVVLSMGGVIQQANPALWQLFGREPDDTEASLLEQPFADVAKVTALIERTRLSAQPESADLELRGPGGPSRWVHCILKLAETAAGGAPHIEGVLYDITRRHEQERAARHSAEHDALTGLKSRTFIETALETKVQKARSRDDAVTLMFVDLDGFKGVNDRWGHAAGDAVLVESAQRLRGIFKRDSDLVGRLGGDELVVLLDGVRATDAEVGALAARMIDALKRPFGLPNGEQARIGASVGLASFPMHAMDSQTLIRAADAAMYAVKKAGKGGFVVAVGRDEPVTVIDGQAMAEADDSTSIDPLTGLPDRRALLRRLHQMKSRLVVRGGHAAVVCVDLDDFRSVNLTHGPQVGDGLLCDAAGRLRKALRRDDTVARTGSDEFVAVIALEAQDACGATAAARAVVEKLASDLKRPADPSTLTIHASIGVSLLSDQTPDARQVLQESQLAVRLAKSRQRGGILFFEPGMMNTFLQQRGLEQELRNAIAGDQLRLHVQPQVDRWANTIGGEALLRWNHPTRGPIPPSEFIPLAEATGAIVELGRWVLRTGCRILAAMNPQGRPVSTLALNISPLQFAHPDFVRDVLDALHAASAPPGALILEITEGVLLSDLSQVRLKLRELSDRGIRFSIDDFGTGFSSLGYLRQMTLHEIKIDRSFISGLPEDQASVGIVRSILAMGQHLGLRVVAEGVETRGQAEFLSANGCAVQQGWLHGRPQPADLFIAQMTGPRAIENLQGPDTTASTAALELTR